MQITLIDVNYTDPRHAEDLRVLLNEYACDPMGGGQPVDSAVLVELPGRLNDFPTAFSVIAYADGEPAGLANCFFGFSTFAARRLVNVHDVVVRPAYRGRGISRRLFGRIEEIARQNDCCKITLEVLEKNEVALAAYRDFGFAAYELGATQGQAIFMQKKLGPERPFPRQEKTIP